MGEALRDAYARACEEHESAREALAAAQARMRAASEACERLETALRMTDLSDGLFPEASARHCAGSSARLPRKPNG